MFAARTGASVAGAGGVHGLSAAARADLVDAVQTVFLVAAPLAALAFLLVLFLREVPLAGAEAEAPRPDAAAGRDRAGVTALGRGVT